jgi:hypothetical protein
MMFRERCELADQPLGPRELESSSREIACGTRTDTNDALLRLYCRQTSDGEKMKAG